MKANQVFFILTIFEYKKQNSPQTYLWTSGVNIVVLAL
jgi:hypothetical protein